MLMKMKMFGRKGLNEALDAIDAIEESYLELGDEKHMEDAPIVEEISS